MINLKLIPQRADFKSEYTVNEDILTIKIKGKTEVFDFTGFEEGIATEIIPEILSINPILSAEKAENTISIKAIRFYTAEEKGEFENGNY